VKVGLTYCHPSGQAASAIDYVVFQEKHESEVLKIQKLVVFTMISHRSLKALSICGIVVGFIFIILIFLSNVS
jgi:hypothetical protein